MEPMSSATPAPSEARKARVAEAPAFSYDEQKLQELILYIAEKSADDPSFGDTKLNKLLWFSDFLAYATYGRPITGAVYQKLEHGPAPRRLLPARKALIDGGDVDIVRKGRAYKRNVTVNRRPANTRLFDTEQLDLVDEVIELLRHHDASDVSALSHQLSAGWQLADMYEDIPYDSIFLSVSQTLTPYEVQRGHELAAKLDLLAA